MSDFSFLLSPQAQALAIKTRIALQSISCQSKPGERLYQPPLKDEEYYALLKQIYADRNPNIKAWNSGKLFVKNAVVTLENANLQVPSGKLFQIVPIDGRTGKIIILSPDGKGLNELEWRQDWGYHIESGFTVVTEGTITFVMGTFWERDKE
ncbi:unnamed protein product [Clonostachys rosea f. rosea IK726]|uniref:Uncharacterized protein n=1 Tax=Clonostachys rosea f. rosea IK726 TaxID=1349383 RepID=A0ACA9TEQ0_BIOOC|nr:unnamed protein product [Clonostachys rosea f. rosea IK726]